MAWAGLAQTIRNVVRIPGGEGAERSDVISARFVRHLLVGGSTTVFYMVGLIVLVEVFAVRPVFSTMISFGFCITYAYTLNHIWVYRSRMQHSYSVPRYLVVTGVAFTLNVVIMYLWVDVFGWWYIWGQLGAAVVVPPTNFVLNYFWAFK